MYIWENLKKITRDNNNFKQDFIDVGEFKVCWKNETHNLYVENLNHLS